MKNSSVKVLLVDDDEDDYVVTEDLLDSAEIGMFELQWIDNYEQALEAVSQKNHDVYLFDYRLGPQTGLDLLKEAMERGVRSPIILLTGLGDHDIDSEAMKIGAADYLIKGQMDTAILERSILHAIERKQTDAKQDQLVDELEEANRELKNLAYLISQDLQAPMRTISSLAELIGSDYGDKFDEKGKGMLQLLKNTIGRMNKQIDNLMNNSKLRDQVKQKAEE